MKEEIKELVAAAFSGLWVETLQADEAERSLIQMAAQNEWDLVTWDIAQGARFIQDGQQIPVQGAGPGDPIGPLKIGPANGKTRLVLLHNYHRFLNNPVAVQTLYNTVVAGKTRQLITIILAPSTQPPPEIERVFTAVSHPLPTGEELLAIATELNPEGDPPHTDAVAAASGLTHYEAESAFALSLAKHGEIQQEEVSNLKTKALKKSGLLTLYQGDESFSTLGGLDNLKTFCSRALTSNSTTRPRGVLLLGVPGTGKSAFAKALGNATHRRVLGLDPGTLMGSHVGDTEAQTRTALKIADAMAPCVLFIDEVEKALAGATSQHQGDSGVSARMLGTLLTWLNDHTTDVFVVCTSNDASRLPPEFSRAERFDGVFFLDLPNRQEKDAIWAIYRKCFGIDDPCTPDDDQWTGAEIRACCRLASLLELPLKEAAINVVPVAVTAEEKIANLRLWASNRCLDATRPGRYRQTTTTHAHRRSLS